MGHSRTRAKLLGGSAGNPSQQTRPLPAGREPARFLLATLLINYTREQLPVHESTGSKGMHRCRGHEHSAIHARYPEGVCRHRW